MKRVTLPALWLLVLLAVPLSACFEPKSVTCSSGLVCPQNQACSDDGTQCIQTACGDGKIQAGEACDDGNIRPGDGCSADCKSDESCGNHTVDTDEVCDDGNTASGDGCSADCKSSEKCGDRLIDKAIGEVCDDGNTKDGDKCSANCRSDESCGNNFVDKLVGEVCDDGNTKSGDGCGSDCRSGEGCPNGSRDLDEECDDGNAENNDECLNNCHIARCGDGFVNSNGGEECDPQKTPTLCNFDCTVSKCGDGKVNPATEQCDNLGPTNTATCTTLCMVSFCGDNFTNPATTEECDDGNADNNDTCLNTCKNATCGDGYTSSSETCDLGTANGATECDYGTTSCKLCKGNCTVEETGNGSYCGDGTWDTAEGGEICDDGNNVTESQCPYGPVFSCSFCSSNCKVPTTGSPARYCGNGTPDAPYELCDDGNALACGTCDSTCKVSQDLATATGKLIATAPNNIKDMEIFVLNDGVHVVEFEFNSNGSVSNGRTGINIATAISADDIADRIRLAINGVTTGLTITATGNVLPNADTLTLTNDNPGSLGNHPIFESVSNSNFKVTGMSGGSGRDCPQGIGCKTTNDCAISLICNVNGVCQ